MAMFIIMAAKIVVKYCILPIIINLTTFGGGGLSSRKVTTVEFNDVDAD